MNGIPLKKTPEMKIMNPKLIPLTIHWSGHFISRKCEVFLYPLMKVVSRKKCRLTDARATLYHSLALPLTAFLHSASRKLSYRSIQWCKGSFIVHCSCVGVLIYRSLFAASHRSITAFQVKMNFTFMRLCNEVTLQFLCSRVQCGNATQLRHSMNGP